MTLNRQKLRKVIIVLLILTAYYIFRSVSGISIPCPVYTATHHHIKCPGCGMTRACESLLRLDLKSAFYYHPAFIIISPLFTASMIAWLFDKAERFRLFADIATIAVLVGYFILRNIPALSLN